MRRVVSVWLPHWPTDRWRRSRPGVWPDASPLVTASHDGRRRVVAGADAAAGALGLHPGLPLTQAQARVPGLAIVEAEPAADAAALTALAGWCIRTTPLTAPDPPDGLWLDITGCAHLAGGEAALLETMAAALRRGGIAARAAVADTPGAAHAVARHGGAEVVVVPQGGTAAALEPLPIAALRLDPAAAEGLRRLGFSRIGPLAATPRGPLARRFGAEPLRRLDQALGRVPEPIAPVFPPEAIQHRVGFVEPLLTAEALAHVIAHLVARICRKLEAACLGARRLDLIGERIDGTRAVVSVGTSRPARVPGALARLLTDRLPQVDPEPGIEAMRLVVGRAEPFEARQSSHNLVEEDGAEGEPDISELVDRLAARLGRGRVYRIAAVESDVPERAVRRVPPLGAYPIVADCGWPREKIRPPRLLRRPLPVEATALLPDHPPAAFMWRGVRRRVRRADGPERVFGEWWRRDAERDAVRDYFRVEDDQGRRYWLFRQGDGVDPATGGLRWFLHGLF